MQYALDPSGAVPAFDVLAPGAHRSVATGGGEGWLGQLGAGSKPRAQLQVALRVQAPGAYFLLLSGDGGLEAQLDGHSLLRAEAPRSYYGPGDIVPVELGAGPHTLRFTTTKATRLGVRVVDARFQPALGRVEVQHAIKAKRSGLQLSLQPRFGEHALALHVRLRESLSEPAEVEQPVHLTLRVGEQIHFEGPLGVLQRGELSVRLPDLPRALLGAPIRLEVRRGAQRESASLQVDPAVFDAVQTAREAVRGARSSSRSQVSLDSVAHLADLLEELVRTQDPDAAFRARTLSELNELSAKLARGEDPYEGRSGPQRRAMRSPVDGHLHEFALYAPAKPRPGLPLVVVLHGLRGKPLTILRYFFGGDDRSLPWQVKERNWDPSLPSLDAWVIAPSGHGDSMYRWLGEDESLRLIDWAKRELQIDEDRVSVTGASMGGIGAASIPFHHPGVFAAAAPLCGYHSYFLRADVARMRRESWEKFQSEERSNVQWAVNGHGLPLFVAHGTRDLPVQNSGVLIDRYKELGYRVQSEHPDIGHNVWEPIYANLKAARWLIGHKRQPQTTLRFRTVRPRYGQSHWLRLAAQNTPGSWSELSARVEGELVQLTTQNTRSLEVDRALAGLRGDAELRIDGTTLRYAAEEPLQAHFDGQRWQRGQLPGAAAKRGPRTGPIRDLFHEPLVFVYGTRDPRFTPVSKQLAAYIARVRPGAIVDYPVISDVEALRPDRIAKGTSVVSIGPASANAYRAQYTDRLPSKIDDGALLWRGSRYEQPGTGVAYVRPHPDDDAAYLAVFEAIDPEGLRQAMALPELLPDYVVWDRQLAPARAQILLGRGRFLDAGTFDRDWNLPSP